MIVDIHNHILPGVDDGAKEMAETLQMAQQAVGNGITHVIATPHHRNGKYICSPIAIMQMTAKVNAFLKSCEIRLKVLPGMEVHLYGDLAEDLNRHSQEIITLNNKKNMC
ncbi:hypothetical protein CD798_03255 [Bacillaceae bacterium SAOS 7]|nr:hypothetical protein CD798_03255 [Bacillaceae bacterium SAOS 7]